MNAQEKKALNDKVHPKDFADALIKRTEINELISNLTDESNQSEIEHILNNIPENDIVFRKTSFNNIKEKTPLTLRDINELYNNLHRQPEVKNGAKKKGLTITQLETNLKRNPKNEKNEYLKYDKKLIEITPSKIYLLSLNKFGGYNREIVADFSLKLQFKTIDYKKDNRTYYTFEANNNLFYNYGIIDFLNIYADKIYKGTLGRDIVKFVFSNPSKKIPEMKAKRTCGFKNKWYLTFIKGDFALMWDTDEQKEVINRCRKIYKKYNQEEKKEIISMLKELIEITDMPKEYITIIVAWSIIAPFKLYFIKYFDLFIHLMLSGKLTAGKTTFLNMFTTHFFNVFKKHTAGLTVKTIPKFEDIATASTFPRMLDQFEGYSRAVIDALKEMATSKSNYKRKTGLIHQISKPKVAPICGTSNTIGEHFKEPSDLSRAVILDYEKPIKQNLRWAKLSNKLKKKKPFSLLYDYTKDWTNKDITELIKEANQTINIDKEIEKIEKANNGITDIDISYPRIRKAYQIITTGAYLFREVFGIKLPLKNVFETLLKLRRNVGEELLDRFIAFCKQAKDFTFVERPPHYLTVPLKWNNTDGYNFDSLNLGDFNTFMKKFGNEIFNKKKLAEQLIDTLTNKSLIKHTTRRKGYTKPTDIIVISDKLIGKPIPPID